ncbi:MAG TPA: DUF4082 domain-containing protein [Thermoanaerobaculia bacterium]|nr:DUF4082 domain-containing protein [Thermoanaerobaculia bacterium]
MRSVRLFHALALAALTALTATSAHAAGQTASSGVPPSLFTIDKTARPATEPSQRFLPDAAEEFLIQTDPAAVAANPQAFTIDLPDLPLLEAVRTRFVVYGPDWKSWIGRLRYAGSLGKGAGYIHLGYHGDQLTAVIEFEGHHFRITGGKESQRLARISEDLSPPSCGLDDSAAGPPLLGDGQKDSAAPASAAPATDTNTDMETSKILATHRIDVLAVYPLAFFSRGPAAETALFNFIRDSISLANDAFANSLIDAAYNLVGIVPVTGASQPPSTGITDALNWLTGQPTEVANLRNAFGADVVTVYIPWSWSSLDRCGIANLPRTSTSYLGASGLVNEALGDRAFTANRDGCGLSDYTLGHEIGHNYGMRHDTDNSATALFPNGRGNVITANSRLQATVMGCFCTGCFCSNICTLGSGAVCNRIPYFSDPNINYLGVPTGAADRNNADVGRTQVSTYAAFRAQSANTPPTANFTVSCAGRICTFNGTSSTDNSGIVSYLWDFGDGTMPMTGSTINHTYGAGISFPVHLVVTDNGANGGQKAVKAGIAEPQPVPLYEGFHEVASCSAISGWAWDQNSPNSPINVSIDRDNIHITTVAANLFRQDLVNAGKGNGFHAFVYPVDTSWKDGVSHSVRVRFNNTATNLTWAPRTLLCGVTCFTNQAPLNSLSTMSTVYTVATQFSSSVSGTITHLGFYRAPGESGSNVGRLWTDGGVQLAQVTFTNGISSGWVWATLSSPVAITAGVRYRVGVNTNFEQAKTNGGIGMGITNQYLTAHQGFWLAGNGVFPTTSSVSNYFVDVKFDP